GQRVKRVGSARLGRGCCRIPSRSHSQSQAISTLRTRSVRGVVLELSLRRGPFTRSLRAIANESYRRSLRQERRPKAACAIPASGGGIMIAEKTGHVSHAFSD